MCSSAGLARQGRATRDQGMNGLSQSYERQTPFGREQVRDLPWVKVIPYDYVADFQITGAVGNVIQDVINISVEGVFVAE